MSLRERYTRMGLIEPPMITQEGIWDTIKGKLTGDISNATPGKLPLTIPELRKLGSGNLATQYFFSLFILQPIFALSSKDAFIVGGKKPLNIYNFIATLVKVDKTEVEQEINRLFGRSPKLDILVADPWWKRILKLPVNIFKSIFGIGPEELDVNAGARNGIIGAHGAIMTGMGIFFFLVAVLSIYNGFERYRESVKGRDRMIDLTPLRSGNNGTVGVAQQLFPQWEQSLNLPAIMPWDDQEAFLLLTIATADTIASSDYEDISTFTEKDGMQFFDRYKDNVLAATKNWKKPISNSMLFTLALWVDGWVKEFIKDHRRVRDVAEYHLKNVYTEFQLGRLIDMMHPDGLAEGIIGELQGSLLPFNDVILDLCANNKDGIMPKE